MTNQKRTCPACGTAMKTAEAGNREIDVCPGCGGTFFEFDEMSAVLKSPAEGTFLEISYGDATPDRTEAAICPKCGTAMEETEYALSKTHVDQCPKCSGIFLDRGESEEINRYLTSMESPDAAKAEDEKYERMYESKVVEMAKRFLREVYGKAA